ncbi:MAG: autotransporter-associated beta strand repeat-containing protein, partial [Prevotella sp.]|nr:autotransporter-associated beta strand repeat-containing protein [Prevotella sp.]
MRFRMGHGGTSGKDCAGVANGTNMIFDHCSFAWGLDENFSINPDGKGDLQQITLSNCLIGQGLMDHSAGGLMQADSITLYRNLYVDNSTRNNKVKGINQYVNNMVYNWKDGAYIMGGDSEGSSYCNIESNMFINGPCGGGEAFTSGNNKFHCYVDDNWQDKNTDGIFDPSIVTSYSDADVVSTPYSYPTLEKWEAMELVDSLLPFVGASLPYRDYVDYYMIDEVKSFGTKGAFISNEETLPFGVPSSWTVWGGNSRVDTDGDGMPDWWETANGTDPNSDDAMTIASNGYANIENYINSITVEDRDFFLRAPQNVSLQTSTTTTMTISWSDYTYGEDGFIVEVELDGVFTEVGRTEADATSFVVTGMEPGTYYNVRVRAFSSDGSYSDYSSITEVNTRPLDADIVDIDTYEPDLTWSAGSATWDFESASWNNNLEKFEDGKKILFAPEETQVITLNETVSPSVVVVNGSADLTISGSGCITGDSVSINKAGKGTLTLETSNTYTGATVLHEGTLEITSLKDGSQASSIGASLPFAQNWVFDGGIYKYTGGSTSTNRAAKITRETEFNIQNSSSTVTVTGAFEGEENFVLSGEGQLTVASPDFFTYTGATVLKGGTMYLSTLDVIQNEIGNSSKLVFSGGHLKTTGESENYETYYFPIEVTENTTSEFSPNRNCYLRNTVTGAGTLQINIPYLREYLRGDYSGFTGHLVANGVCSSEKTSLCLIYDNKRDLSNCVIDLRGNAQLGNWDTDGDQTIGGISGTSGTYIGGSSKNTRNFTCSWTVGTANTDETFEGKINNWSLSGSSYTGTVSITKQGTGDWRLTGSNDYSGTTDVKAGSLIINGTNSGTGKVTVYDEAYLKGTGSISGNVIIEEGATVYAGDTLVNSSKLSLKGGCTVNSGGIVEIPLYLDEGTAKSNSLSVSGAFAINGATLSLNMANVNGSLEDDQAFQVFDVSGATISGEAFKEISPESPSDTQQWDTTELFPSGKIYVRSEDWVAGIDKVTLDDENNSNAPKYDLSGKRINDVKTGIY